jgi:hypothetical protein
VTALFHHLFLERGQAVQAYFKDIPRLPNSYAFAKVNEALKAYVGLTFIEKYVYKLFCR